MNFNTRLSVGDIVECPGFGLGIVRDYDGSVPQFAYLCDFRGKGGNGSLAWLPKHRLEMENAFNWLI